MFYVYHIPENKKVGATNNITRRMKQQRIAEGQYSILSVCNTAEEASIIEEDMRKFYKYKPDADRTYIETLKANRENMSPRSKRPKREKINKASRNVGLNEIGAGMTSSIEHNRALLLDFLNLEDTMTLGTEGGTFTFTRGDYAELAAKAIKSWQATGDFYWSHVILKSINNDKTETLREACESTKATIPEFQQIRDWAEEKGIFTSGDSKTQFLKLQEEAGEVARAILKQDKPEIIDGLGDTLVVLINLSHLCGYRLEDCLASAYNVIKDRKGKMNNGTFVKETL